MRRLRILGVIASLAVASAAQALGGVASHPAPAPAAPAPPQFQSPSNLKARQVVQQAISALGGPAYLHFRGRRGQGHLFTFNLRGQLANPGTVFWSYYRYPDAERIELTKHRNVIYIYNGRHGWNVNFRGVTPLGPSVMRRFRQAQAHSLDAILRKWAENPRTLMLYHGANLATARPVEKVSFYAAGGLSATVSFSVQTHLPLEVSWRTHNPYTGGFSRKSVTFGNYQPFDGIETPLVVESYEGAIPRQEEYFTSIHYGPLPAKLFEPPARRR